MDDFIEIRVAKKPGIQEILIKDWNFKQFICLSNKILV